MIGAILIPHPCHGVEKQSSGRCCLKAFVELGVKEEETKHKSDKSKPFSLHYMMYICDFAESVIYLYVQHDICTEICT